MYGRRLASGVVFATVLLLSGLGATVAQTPESEEEGGYSPQANVVAPLVDASGGIVGYVAVGGEDGELEVIVLADGLNPGQHGVHLHETGNCDPAGEKPFSAAGAHFNPGGMHHGMHAGDLGNLTADESGSGVLFFGSTSLTFDQGMYGLADADGTALVIHADPDDGMTDPSGNSGARIACAVLAAAQ